MPEPGSTSLAQSFARWMPLVGIALILLAGAIALVDWRNLHAHERAMATVEENLQSMGPKGHIVYTPRLRFALPSGALVHTTGPASDDDPTYATGETLRVMWTKGDPSHAQIATVWQIYWLAIVLGVLGVAVFDFGWILRIRMRSGPVFAVPASPPPAR